MRDDDKQPPLRRAVCTPRVNGKHISVVLEVPAYDSYKNVLPTYYEVVLQTKYIRDEESPAMLDLIREGRIYDIGYFYDNTSFVYEINSIYREMKLKVLRLVKTSRSIGFIPPM